MVWSYGQAAHLYFRGAVLLSRQGGLQGDPKLPAAFATSLRRLLVEARAAGDKYLARAVVELLMAFLDDGLFAGHAHAVCAALIYMDKEGPRRGFRLKWPKVELIFPAGPLADVEWALAPLWAHLPAPRLRPKVHFTPEFALLKSPIGCDDYCTQYSTP